MSSISETGFTAVAWTFAGIAVALSAGRYAIRLRTGSGLHWDDLFHGLALLTLVIHHIIYTAVTPQVYDSSAHITTPEANPSPADVSKFLRLKFATLMLLWITFYLIKASFLAFYRELFGVSGVFLRAWWAVIGLTFVTFWIGFLSLLWMCGAPLDLFVADKCLSFAGLKSLTQLLSMDCALNAISDLSIMVLPLWMLWGLQMRTIQKISLSCVFLLAVIDIIFDTIRTAYTVRPGFPAPYTDFDALVVSIAVIISALPTYRVLFPSPRKRKAAGSENLELGKHGASSL